MASLTPRADKKERNQCINGALDFWQRGAGPVAIPSIEQATGYYLADRYNCRNEVATAAANSLRSTDVPTFAQANFDFQYSLEVDITTAKAVLAGGDSARFKTTFEGMNTVQFIRRGFRIQFWVKSNKTGTYGLIMFNSGSTRRFKASYTITVADTWEHKTVDVPAETTGTWLKNESEGLQIIWAHADGGVAAAGTGDWLAPAGPVPGQVNLYDNTANYWRITGIALYPGTFSSSVELPFNRAGLNSADEFAMCQRYYEKSYAVNTAPADTTSINSEAFRSFGGSGSYDYTINFKVPKRATPTMTAFAPTSGTSGVWRNNGTGADTAAVGFANTGDNRSRVSISGLSINHDVIGHWTASAEL